MAKETKFVSFFNQKGGVGKTTLEILVASYCHSVLDLKVGIMDADFPQHSVQKLREDEISLVRTQASYQNAFKAQGKKVYPIIPSNPGEALTDLKQFENTEEPFDIVFVDLPGTVNTKGVLSTISKLDHIFIPLIADQLVVKSSLEFGLLVNQNFIGKPDINLKSLHFLWNNVVKSEKSNLYTATEKVVTKAGMHILKTQLYQSVKFRKPEFRSTIFPMEAHLLKDTNMVPLIEEILTVIGVTVAPVTLTV